MFGIGMTELLVILTIGLLVIGPKKLPELARSLAKGLAEFRRASTEMRREFLDVADEVRIDPPFPQTPEQRASTAESEAEAKARSESAAETKAQPEDEAKAKAESGSESESKSGSEPRTDSASEKADETKPGDGSKDSKVG